MPFLEFDLSNLFINISLLSDVSYFKIKISLQDFGIYEISPSPILPCISLQKISSMASFSLNNSLPVGGAQVRTLSQDGLERRGHDAVPTESPCPSVFDSMGVSDVRSGFKYVRLVSRRHERESMPKMLRKNSKSNGLKHGSKSLFSTSKSSRGNNAYEYQQRSSNDIHEQNNYNEYDNDDDDDDDDNVDNNNCNRNNNNVYDNNDNYNKNTKFNDTSGPRNLDSLLPLFSFQFEHTTNSDCKQDETNGTENNNPLNEKEDYTNNNDKKKKIHINKVKNENIVTNENFSFSMEELEILFSPSSKWLAAIGTFFAQPPTAPDECRYNALINFFSNLFSTLFYLFFIFFLFYK